MCIGRMMGSLPVKKLENLGLQINKTNMAMNPVLEFKKNLTREVTTSPLQRFKKLCDVIKAALAKIKK